MLLVTFRACLDAYPYQPIPRAQSKAYRQELLDEPHGRLGMRRNGAGEKGAATREGEVDQQLIGRMHVGGGSRAKVRARGAAVFRTPR